MGAMEKDVLLILYITSITQVTSRGGIVSPGEELFAACAVFLFFMNPGHCLNL